MTERPEQDRGDSRAAGAGDIVVGRPMGDVYRAVTAYSDPGWGDGGPDGQRDGAPVVSASALLRSKWLIAGVFLAVSAVAVPAVWMFVSPTYTATATVSVAPVMTRIVYNTQDNTTALPLYPQFMGNQVATLTSPGVLQRVVQRDDVQRTAWRTREPRTLQTLLGSPPPSPLERLKADLEVAQTPNTNQISVELTSTNPADTDVLVNAVVEEYLKYSDEERQKEQRKVLVTLNDKHTNLMERIKGQRDQIRVLSKRLGADDPDIVRSSLTQQLGDLEMKRNEVERAYQMALGELKRVQEGQDAGGTPQAGRYAGDPEWQRRNEMWEKTRQELNAASRRLGPENPDLKDLEDREKDAERNVRQREKELDEGLTRPVGLGWPTTQPVLILDEVTLARTVATKKLELDLFNAQIDKVKKEREEKGELAGQVAQEKAELDDKLAERGRVQDAIIARETEQQAPGRISAGSRAVPPSKPTRDRRLVLSVVAMGGAWMAGFAVAYLRTARNPKIHEARDVQRAVHVPFLGELPPLPTVADLRAGCDPRLTEGIRMVRTALLERMKGSGHRVVLITSSSPEAGKSTVAALLCKSLAALGQKVLLVEADLRKPSLSGRLGIRSDVGLAELLTGATDDPHAIVPTGVKGFDIVLAGQDRPDFSAELLANGACAACLTRWRNSYNFVLLDSPPVLPVADARILAGHADGILMVLRSSHSRRAEVVQAYADLSATGTPLLGTILVGDKHWRRYPYDYSYSERRDARGDGALEA